MQPLHMYTQVSDNACMHACMNTHTQPCMQPDLHMHTDKCMHIHITVPAERYKYAIDGG